MNQNGPFGVRMPNNLTFELSAHNPNSRLSKLVNHLRICRKMGYLPSRRALLNVALDKPNVGRSWGSCLFTGAQRARFIQKHRVGRRVVYSLGVNADKVI